MASELEAARLSVYQAAWAHDCGNADAKQKSSMAKLYATEAAQRIVDQVLQIHGGNGLLAGSIMERLYRAHLRGHVGDSKDCNCAGIVEAGMRREAKRMSWICFSGLAPHASGPFREV
jgi:alkylation response protein AidB-like acyl-CoA dehydrogenase